MADTMRLGVWKKTFTTSLSWWKAKGGIGTYFCWSVGFWIMVFSPSITCCFN